MIVLPVDSLPSAPADRHGTLRNYFCDKDATATRTKDGWELSLAWSDDLDRHVDPRLLVGLNWWNNGITPAEMVLAIRKSGRLLTSLYDTWALYGWSKWLADQTDLDTSSVVILHVDDHRDLDPPRLFIEGSRLRDPLTGCSVELGNPDSIRKAILSGAVGMGSFMTPFLHVVPNAEVRHLCQPPKAPKTRTYRILRNDQADSLIDKDARRPAVCLHENVDAVGPGTYRVTPDIQDWLSDIGSGPILLHIDMDYFNNRYDGDSDWQERDSNLDPSLQEILAKIDELTITLAHTEIAPRIEHIAVAFSPGFFPAEYWSTAANCLLPALENLHGR